MIDQKIIAWMMKGSAEYNKVARDIDPKVLYETFKSDYKPLFKEMENYFYRYKTPPSYELLKEELIQEEDAFYGILEIEETTCEETEILYYVDKIKKRYNAELAARLAKSVANDSDDIDIEEFNTNLNQISSKISRLHKSSILAQGRFSESVDERIGQYLNIEENPMLAAGVLSGFPELDNFTNGIQKSELLLIAGASSSGKSLFMLNYAINAWLGSNKPSEMMPLSHDDGKNILFFTLEMSKKQLEQRMDANVAEIRHKALIRGYLTDEEKERWYRSLDFQRNYDKIFHIVDMPRGSRTMDLEAQYDTLLAEYEPDLVAVDYLGIMGPNKDFGSDWLDVGQVAADLHEFCRTRNVAVITAAQRKSKNKNAKVQAQDTEEIGRSKLIGDNLNIGLLIEQRDDEKLRDDIVIHVTKNRDGEKGEFRLFKEFEKSKFKSIPDNWAKDFGNENAV